MSVVKLLKILNISHMKSSRDWFKLLTLVSSKLVFDILGMIMVPK